MKIRMHKRSCRQSAFTLIELLVVISIIALLLSIIVPTLTRVKEHARRTICQSNIRSFYIGIVAYSSENDSLVPQGGDFVGVDVNDYIFLLDDDIHQSLSNNTPLSLVCPNLLQPYRKGGIEPFGESGLIDRIDGYLIGYNYLGGFSDTPWTLIDPAEAEWISPKKITENPRQVIITELNTWITEGQYQMTFAPHGYWGPIHSSRDSTNKEFNGVPPDELGAVGGHIGTLDGAIQWKDIEDMEIHMGSREGSYPLFAYW